MNWLTKLFSPKELPWTVARFFLVGIILFILPVTRPLFYQLTPWVLIISLAIMLAYHKNWNPKFVIISLLVYALSFLLEMKGTADERFFGAYAYMTTLGIKVLDTPLLIGINWLMLVYGSYAISYRLFHNKLFRILSGASLMVIYDVIVEVSAPAMKMWYFDQGYPPAQNFLMWFIAATVFHSLFTFANIKADNYPARVMFYAQVGFFGILSTYILLRF